MSKYVGMSVADIITDLGKTLMSELAIPGEVTKAILTFAIDVVREDVYYHPDEVLRSYIAEPENCSLCRTTAARLFNLLGAGAVDDEYEFAGSEAKPEQKRQVAELAVRMARTIRASVLGDKREIYRIKYANHEFVVVIRNRRAEILQSFQAFYGAGHGVEIANSLADGDLELCLAMMAAGGEMAGHAQEIAFGKPLSADMPSEVFAYKKASLVGDDLIVERLREHMRASLQYYKELATQSP